MIRTAEGFQAVVRGGALQTRGMPSWDDLLSATEVEQIRTHLVALAHDAYTKQQGGAASAPQPVFRQGHL